MATVLAFNPGSASLKFDVVDLEEGQPFASQGRKQISASIEGIGKAPRLLIFRGREVERTESCDAQTMGEGASFALKWLGGQRVALEKLTLVGLRVVHGGSRFSEAMRWDQEIEREVERLTVLAPLHNRSSLDIAAAVQAASSRPIFAAFDTAFHRTMPEVAWRYPIERETADRFEVRKYGFHGLSHRYMLDEYVRSSGRRREDVSLVTLHLESGSSAAAIRNGRSVDTTMGLTPLEGLMMGSRSGSVDPAVVPYLMHRMGASADEVLTLLNKRSGLLGIAGGTLDTRELVRRGDEAAALALQMFAYRVRLAVGAYLAALGEGTEAVLFGGGIGENTPPVRADVCKGLGGFGLRLDQEANRNATEGMHRISTEDSRLSAWTIPVEEGLQIAHECLAAAGRP